MAEIPVQKKTSLAWLWILLAVLLAASLLWWLLSGSNDNEVGDPADRVAEAGAPVTDAASLLGANAAGLAGREVRLQGVQVQEVEEGRALLVGPGASNALLVVPEGATIPDGVAAGDMVDVAGVARPKDALGQNRPTSAGRASGELFVSASKITMSSGAAGAAGAEGTGAEGTAAGGTGAGGNADVGGAAGAGRAGTPPSAESVAEANRQALQRLTNDPNTTPRVYFQWGSAEVTSGAKAVLDKLIQSRADARTGGIRLVGFADRSGPPSYNRELSERRAEEVRRYLAGKGISRDMIEVEAEGETPTRVKTGDGVREPLNRRVRVELSDAN